MTEPLLVTISDAALMLGVSERTVYRMLEEGTLSRVVVRKTPRVTVSSIRALVGEPVREPSETERRASSAATVG